MNTAQTKCYRLNHSTLSCKIQKLNFVPANTGFKTLTTLHMMCYLFNRNRTIAAHISIKSAIRSRRMKRFGLTGLLSLFAVGLVLAEPVTVYDLSVTPDSPNKKVTVNYRLGETPSRLAAVAVNVSSNAGESWTIPATTFYPESDVGYGVPADGSLRSLVWDARADWNNQFSTQMIVRLEATTAPLQSQIYFVAGDVLYKMNMDGSDVVRLASGLNGLGNLVADPHRKMLFMTRWDTGATIHYYNLEQGGSPAIYRSGPASGGGQGLAYDSAEGQFFAGIYYSGVYSLSEAAGSTWQQLVTSSQISPLLGQRGQIFLDPHSKHVYFRTAYNGSCDRCRYIWRVNYDGTGLTQVIRANDGDGLYVDHQGGHIYFTDGDGSHQLIQIKRCNLDGSSPVLLLTLQPPYQRCLNIEVDAVGGKIYLYLDGGALAGGGNNFNSRAIARANLDGTDFEILWQMSDLPGGGGSTGLDIVYP